MTHPNDCRELTPFQLTQEMESLFAELTTIRAEMINLASPAETILDKLNPTYHESARNLLHYLALRRHDLRPLQLRLAALGLSSLGRAESHVLATVDAVLRALHRLIQRDGDLPDPVTPALDFAGGQRLLTDHTERLLGPVPPGREVRIMVTMPSEAADDYMLVHNLVKQGMDCMRINCAHDDTRAWKQMIDHLRHAEASLGRSCQVVMDLAGPKLRTGPLEPGPTVMKIRPQRDVYGKVVAPARVWLTNEESPVRSPSPADAILPVSADWLAQLEVGDAVKFRDLRGAPRTLHVVDATDDGCWAELKRVAYIVPGIVLHLEPGDHRPETGKTEVGVFAPRENPISLQQGDLLILTRNLKPGRPATVDSRGRILCPASIGCTLPEVFDDIRAGERIWFDDGKIGGVIERIEVDRILVRITQTAARGAKLRSDKGINLPDSALRLSALTEKDIADLRFVVHHADAVALSFANQAQDVDLLREEINRIGGPQPAVILKIETRRGFENLAAMLLTAMRMPCSGVMIARGDLAVECGFERLAEVQEEILWICEAAHVPVIWATQVLETLARQGMPSRAEITDAAMGHRAECVMLNKGPFVVNAVQVLDDILQRMQPHQAKKSAMLRELRLAHLFPQIK